MATSTTLVPIEEYLETVYRPDCDWINGELRERNMGEKPHARIQGFLCFVFLSNEESWGVEALPEQRLQTSAHHYRIADVCVTRLGEASGEDELIVRTPPLLCIEILSRDDRMSEMQERVDDYLGMGVATVWLLDPRRRKASSVDAGGSILPVVDSLTVPGTAIRIAVDAIFAVLDKR